jgi:hypothetical protein
MPLLDHQLMRNTVTILGSRNCPSTRSPQGMCLPHATIVTDTQILTAHHHLVRTWLSWQLGQTPLQDASPISATIIEVSQPAFPPDRRVKYTKACQDCQSLARSPRSADLDSRGLYSMHDTGVGLLLHRSAGCPQEQPDNPSYYHRQGSDPNIR